MTIEQAYEEYTRLRKQESQTNEGVNLLNYSEKCKPKSYHLQVMKIVKTKINSSSVTIEVDSDLPFVNNRYYSNSYCYDKFLEQLKKYVSKPKYDKVISFNKEKKNYYFSGVNAREITINFDSVVIDIGKNANKFFEDNKIDFVGEVKELLSQQKDATEQEIKDFDRATYLIEEVDNLKRLIGNNSGYYGCYEKEKDESLKMTISYEEYNKRLKLVENELKTLELKYYFVDLPRFDYEEIGGEDSCDEEEYDDEDEEEDYC